MLKIKVFQGVKEIDTVFYGDDFVKGFKTLPELKDYVKKSLVEHDGYNPDIWLKISK
jgi:hypothetical protein